MTIGGGGRRRTNKKNLPRHEKKEILSSLFHFKLKKENERLEENQTTLLEDIIFYRTKDSLSAASVRQLVLTNSEFKQHYADLISDAESLNLKVKQLESVSRTSTETIYKIETQWRDSIIFVDGLIDTIRCISYHDNYLTFDACEIDSMVYPNIQVLDTLVQFIHRVPKRFLFIKFGTKAIRQEILSKNPNTNITYTEYINLKKKKK